MEHNCPKCNIYMNEANLDHAGMFRIYKKGADENSRKGLFDFSNPQYLSPITQYVCPKCGFIEFYAKEPEKI